MDPSERVANRIAVGRESKRRDKSNRYPISLYPAFLDQLSKVGDSTCGQRALYLLGMTGIPIVNVNNNCVSSDEILLSTLNPPADSLPISQSFFPLPFHRNQTVHRILCLCNCSQLCHGRTSRMCSSLRIRKDGCRREYSCFLLNFHSSSFVFWPISVFSHALFPSLTHSFLK